MKKLLVYSLTALLAFGGFACGGDDEEEPTPTPPEEQPGTTPDAEWHEMWTDEFDGTSLDAEHWRRIEPYNPPSSGPDWIKMMSTNDACFEFTGNTLKLKGINTPDSVNDPRPYICGGIETRGIFKFLPPFRIDMRVRMTAANGAWPAIWMMPFNELEGWPQCGEIDVMERLNHDNMVYQTVHSAVSGNDNPPHSTTASVNVSDWNVYTIRVYRNSIIWEINGRETFRYKRLSPAVENQFPFYQGQFLRIDMQLGGSWVGSVDPAQLPVEMEVDYVKYFRYY